MYHRHLQNIAAFRTERDADPDLACLLRNGVTHHAVNADRREDEREPGKDREQQHAETLPRNCAGDDVLHRIDVCYRLIFINRPDRVARGGRDHEWCVDISKSLRENEICEKGLACLDGGEYEPIFGMEASRCVFLTRDGYANK